jgi:hypothetical protein
MVTALSLAGVVFEIVGLIITGWGAWKTWREFAPREAGGIADPVVLPLRERWLRTRSLAARIVRRLTSRQAAPVHVVVGTAALSLGAAISARGRVQFRILPDDLDIHEALAELDERTRRLMTSLSDVSDRRQDEAEATRGEIRELANRLDAAVGSIDVLTRRVAVGGIRLQFVGLTVVALGLVMQGVASILR